MMRISKWFFRTIISKEELINVIYTIIVFLLIVLMFCFLGD